MQKISRTTAFDSCSIKIPCLVFYGTLLHPVNIYSTTSSAISLFVSKISGKEISLSLPIYRCEPRIFTTYTSIIKSLQLKALASLPFDRFAHCSGNRIFKVLIYALVKTSLFLNPSKPIPANNAEIQAKQSSGYNCRFEMSIV
jgi:hypothetical protein